MYSAILIIHVIACLVLVFVILLQAGRGGGISGIFGGAAAQAVFGTKAATVLTRATAVCAVTFLLTSLSLAIITAKRSESIMEKAAIKTVAPQTVEVPLKKSDTEQTQTQTSAPAVKVQRVDTDTETGQEK